MLSSPSNPQPRPASNLNVSARRRTLLLVVLLAAFAVVPLLNATPIEPAARQLIQGLQPPAMFVLARAGWDGRQKPAAHFNLTLEQFGPQATARAVRASLKAALTPDPLSMAALLFCAFALRWMRIRKERLQLTEQAAATAEIAEPRAA